MTVLTVVGARPQFVKAAPVSKALRAHGIDEIIVHSGQHYDYGLSHVFFQQLGLKEPEINLGVGSGSHAAQTADILRGLESVFLDVRPDIVLVHGDTNTTLAAALAACKIGIPIAHNEAGLRSFNRSMPEEHNRVLTDHCADILFCPTRSAVEQLVREGIVHRVYQVGDVMLDAVLQYEKQSASESRVLENLHLQPKHYALLTLHRAYTADEPERLRGLFTALETSLLPILFPVHPRTRARLTEFSIDLPSCILAVEPLGFFDMLQAEKHAMIILTDSGGVQKEAYFMGVPCVTLRPETEWRETVEAGWNRVVDIRVDELHDCLTTEWWPRDRPALFGDGNAAKAIATILAGGDALVRG
jgi:UDP-GlcNAc3NAcA epimerase